MGRRIVRLIPKIETPPQRASARETTNVNRNTTRAVHEEYVPRDTSASDRSTKAEGVRSARIIAQSERRHAEAERVTARYGRWVVSGKAKPTPSGEVVPCRCDDCGLASEVAFAALLRGNAPCAGCDLNREMEAALEARAEREPERVPSDRPPTARGRKAEQRYGRWLVLGDPYAIPSGAVVVRCRCEDCGSASELDPLALETSNPPCAGCDLNRQMEAATKSPTQREQKDVPWERPAQRFKRLRAREDAKELRQIRRDTRAQLAELKQALIEGKPPVEPSRGRMEEAQAALDRADGAEEKSRARLEYKRARSEHVRVRCDAGEARSAIASDLGISVTRVGQLFLEAGVFRGSSKDGMPSTSSLELPEQREIARTSEPEPQPELVRWEWPQAEPAQKSTESAGPPQARPAPQLDETPRARIDASEVRQGGWLVIGEDTLVRCRCVECGSERAIGIRSLLTDTPPCAVCDLNRHRESAARVLASLDEEALTRNEPAHARIEQIVAQRERPAIEEERSLSVRIEPSLLRAGQKLVRWERPQARTEPPLEHPRAEPEPFETKGDHADPAQALQDLIVARSDAGDPPRRVARQLGISLVHVVRVLEEARAQPSRREGSARPDAVAFASEGVTDMHRGDSEAERTRQIERARSHQTRHGAEGAPPEMGTPFIESMRAANQRQRTVVQRNIEIQRRAVEGESLEALANAFDLSPTAVRTIIRKRTSLIPLAGAGPSDESEDARRSGPPRRSNETVLALRRTVIERRLAGERHRSIALELGITVSYVALICSEAGVTKKGIQGTSARD